MQHPSGIPEKIVRKVVARRGRLHAFEAIDPKTTALVVIDLDEATVANDDVSQRMTETVNTLAAAVRQGGGVVAWVLSRMTTMPRHFTAILGADLATRYFNDGQAGGAGTRLWHALDRKPDDVVAIKSGASAFFPGKCNLKPQLDARAVDTILIAGAVTNICCESSAPSRPRQTADGPLNVGAQLALNAKPPVRRRRRIRACEQEQCGAGIRAQSR